MRSDAEKTCRCRGALQALAAFSWAIRVARRAMREPTPRVTTFPGFGGGTRSRLAASIAASTRTARTILLRAPSQILLCSLVLEFFPPPERVLNPTHLPALRLRPLQRLCNRLFLNPA